MKLGYTQGSHYWVNFYHYLAGVILGGGHVVVNSTQCDLFFYSYWNAKDAQKCRPGTRLIFVSGECWDTSRFPCSLLIDCKHVPHPRSPYLYYPFYALSFFERSTGTNPTHLIKPDTFHAQSVLQQKTRFCAYMYRYDVDFRVQLFDDINRYKTVDALGKSRNPNPSQATDRGHASYLDHAVEKYRPYKFVICCENQRAPGYVTEKIINAMLAHAIPIYWGAQDISTYFNPRSFIDVGSFASRNDAIDFIRQIDQNDELYCAMMNEPWYHRNVLPDLFQPQYFQKAFQSLPAVYRSRSPVRSSPHTVRSSPRPIRSSPRSRMTSRATLRPLYPAGSSRRPVYNNPHSRSLSQPRRRPNLGIIRAFRRARSPYHALRRARK